jgi:hypothetical protein
MASCDGTTAEALLKNAYVALYRAKSSGGNTYQCYKQNEPMRSALGKSLSIVP